MSFRKRGRGWVPFQQVLLDSGSPGYPPSLAIGKVQGVPDSVRASGSVGALWGRGAATPASCSDLRQRTGWGGHLVPAVPGAMPGTVPIRMVLSLSHVMYRRPLPGTGMYLASIHSYS